MTKHIDTYKTGASKRKEHQHDINTRYALAQTDAEKAFKASTRMWADGLIMDARGRGMCRTDTDTALFQRSLAAILSRAYDRRYPALKTRTLMPASPPMDAGAESVLVRGHEIGGTARLSADYDTEVPYVSLSGNETAYVVYPIRAKWYLAWQQVRAGSMSGIDLGAKGLAAARLIVETELDRVLSLGYIDGTGTVRVRGLVQPAPLLGQVAGALATLAFQGAVNPAGSIGLWAAPATTALNIINDVALLMGVLEANDLYTATDMVLAPAEWNRINSEPVGIVANMTVKQWLENVWGFNITRWNRLTAVPAVYRVAGAAGPRVLIYAKDPEIVEPLISVEMENLPSAWDGAGWSTQVHCRTAGVQCQNPLGFIAYDMA